VFVGGGYIARLTVPIVTAATSIISSCSKIENGLILWYRLIQLTYVHLEKWPLNRREREGLMGLIWGATPPAEAGQHH